MLRLGKTPISCSAQRVDGLCRPLLRQEAGLSPAGPFPCPKRGQNFPFLTKTVKIQRGELVTNIMSWKHHVDDHVITLKVRSTGECCDAGVGIGASGLIWSFFFLLYGLNLTSMYTSFLWMLSGLNCLYFFFPLYVWTLWLSISVFFFLKKTLVPKFIKG